MCSDVTDTANMCEGKFFSPALNDESVSLLVVLDLYLTTEGSIYLYFLLIQSKAKQING